MRLARSANRIVVATEGLARVILLAGLLVVLYYASDRAPPFAVISVEPASAAPGELITIRASVRRDTARDCSAEFSRYVFDSSGSRYDLGSSITSSEMIAMMDGMTPGRLAVRFMVPSSADPGRAMLKTGLEYKCNRTHAWWPIHVTTDMPFTVLPLR